jgi:serine/threonine protein phosphatase PrpC
MRFCYYASNVGKIKSNNEDSLQINKYCKEVNSNVLGAKCLKEKNLVSVCDGLGGEEFGEVAADIAVKEMARISEQLTDENCVDKLTYEFDIINRLICNEIEKKEVRMGTTIVSVYINKETVSFFNIGDSRAYIFENGELTQISKDHSMKNKDGEKTNSLSQHLGIFPDEIVIEPYILENITLSKKAYILLCTDGFYNMVESKKTEEILKKKISNKRKIKELLKCALDNGGKDNITIALIKM